MTTYNQSSSNWGCVYLVGAGPGDVGLLTVRAKNLIESAKVVVYDRLVSDAILALIPADAKRVYVGKAAANHAMKQEDINQLLADLAKEGHDVVRLKGGDPYVFGRGGEEGELLFEQNVRFEVVPGITSAIGGLCYGGVPITHRDLTSSFHVFTGHFKDDERDHDWENIAKLKGTKVFLMGVGNLEYIMTKTLACGMSKDMPVAIISNATRGNQKVLVSTASNVVKDAAEAEIKPPSLLVIGEVVNMREKLNWFESRPLFSKKIAVTRAKAQNSQLAGLLTDLGAEVTLLPSIKIVPKPLETLKDMYEGLSSYNWVVFTSENGVEVFMNGLEAKGLDSRALASAKLAVIGSGTARKLKQYGLNADLIPERFVAEGLIERFEEMGAIQKTDKVLLARASEARDLLPTWLSGQCEVDEVHLYDTVLETEIDEETLSAVHSADFITFTSASTVKNFVKQMDASEMGMPKALKAISIGPVTTKALEEANLNCFAEASVHNLEGLVQTIIQEAGK